MTVRRFTSSELREWQRCPRRWYIRYFLGYGPRRNPGDVSVSRVGTLFHAGTEEYYSPEGGPEEALTLVADTVQDNVQELQAAGKDFLAKKVASNGELVRIMLEGYFDWLEETGADSGLSIVAAESEIETPLRPNVWGDTVTILGKVDTIATSRVTGRRVIIDTKTCQSEKDQQVLAPMSLQFKHYALIEQLRDGEKVDGARVRWARRVKRTARSTPPFYGEVPVEFPTAVLRSYWLVTVALVEQILSVEERLRNGDSPLALGIGPVPDRTCGSCAFRPVCPVFDSETGSETDVLAWSYDKADPLERYDGLDTEEEE